MFRVADNADSDRAGAMSCVDDRAQLYVGTRADLAAKFPAGFHNRLVEATHAARARGDDMPHREYVGTVTLGHHGRIVEAECFRTTAPPWLLELDSDLQAVIFSAHAVGDTGGCTIGAGWTRREALEHLRRALDADARLMPKGEG